MVVGAHYQLFTHGLGKIYKVSFSKKNYQIELSFLKK